MKKLISELTVNPINPRKIGATRKLQLKQSILLFPKMLYIRDIIANTDNVVLAGNQRVSVLFEISHLNEQQIEKILASSRRYASYTDKEKRAVLDYWLEWQKNPEVEVTVSDFTPEEEKEFLIKDNQEYGEFDAEVLQRLYDKNDLIEYGMDDDITSLLEDNEQVEMGDEDAPDLSDNDDDGIGEEASGDVEEEDVPGEILKIGKYRVPVNELEYNRLYVRWMEFVEDTGANENFIQHLLDSRNSSGSTPKTSDNPKTDE